MSDNQASRILPLERQTWFEVSLAKGYRPTLGTPWFADNSREPIRDETIRLGLLPVSAMVERPGLQTTSSTPRYALSRDFANLFSLLLTDAEFVREAEDWRHEHLSEAALNRQRLMAAVLVHSTDEVIITLPGGETRRLSHGSSSLIAQAVVEKFAPYFLRTPRVAWLSESRKKVISRDENVVKLLGLSIDTSKVLPDLILVDFGTHPSHGELLVVFVELVATSGPITEVRKRQLLDIVQASQVDPKNVRFVTAFLDRGDKGFASSIAQIAWGTHVWITTEPRNLVSFIEGNAEAVSGPLSL
jgi:hypothetical protein